MKSNRYYLLFLFCWGCADSEKTFDLRNNSTSNQTNLSRQNLQVEDSNNFLNYTRALLYSWKLTFDSSFIGSGNKLCLTCTTSIQDDGSLAQTLSIVGDNKNAVLHSKRSLSDPIIESIKSEKITLYNQTFLVEQFRKSNIIMINEAHDRVQTRAFLLSILTDLKSAGVTCLAMETLNSKGNLKSLDLTTGYFTDEPIGGQIVREALALGFKLIAYEDTSQFVNYNRDYFQAKNLLSQISNQNFLEKTVVLGGYGHICKFPDTLNYSMAYHFSKMAKVDPLTINQIDFLEASPSGSNYKYVLEKLVGNKIDSFKVIDKKNMFILFSAIFGETPKFNYYDLNIFHPNTEYKYGRPTWLITSTNKWFVPIRIPKETKPVLIQAYLSEEIKDSKDYNIKVPYDQSFTSINDTVWLILKKGNTYNVIFRDENNKIIRKISYK